MRLIRFLLYPHTRSPQTNTHAAPHETTSQTKASHQERSLSRLGTSPRPQPAAEEGNRPHQLWHVRIHEAKATRVIAEPQLSTAPDRHRSKRWRWWYSAISDYRLANPGCTVKEVALALNKGETTIGFIVASDVYKEYEAQRRQEFRKGSEEVLRQKLIGVTTKALDALDVQFEKKKDQVPLELARDIVELGLDRLGFAPASTPSVIVNNNTANVVQNSVSPAALEEARMALRAVEAQRKRPLQLEAEPLPLAVAPISEGEGESNVEACRAAPAIDS
jgi:hypothetical protein